MKFNIKWKNMSLGLLEIYTQYIIVLLLKFVPMFDDELSNKYAEVNK